LDYASIAALATALVALAGAWLGWRRESSAMRLLERVTSVLDKIPSDSSARRPLEVIQRDLVNRVLLRYAGRSVMPSYYFGFAIILFTMAALVIGSGIAFRTILPGAVGPATEYFATALIVLGAIVLLGGLAALVAANVLMQREARSPRTLLLERAGYTESSADAQ